ncbi:MerR family transcriptional regulator [Stappia sp. TSB10GB4]|uniref:MerR family transcriptional regulator n=1 Tax=Stappia sp. TSB10GB4 TaxID=2003584 RepID=UPI001643FCA0|nr:MerR family transcriptional regulator [Stappia sp. TSB10GB4]
MTVEKSPDAFRTISEVADDLDLPQHVLRFWETRFTQIRPLKRGGGRRYYRPDDIDLLRGIRHLLYGEGYTIKGVQRILKEQGPRFVMQVWREDGIALAALAAQPGTDEPEVEDVVPPPAAPPRSQPRAPDFAPSMQAPRARQAEPQFVDPDDDGEPIPRGILPEGAVPPEMPTTRAGFRLMERLLGERVEAPSGNLSKDDIRRLQATLFELLECKRILDQAR